MQPIAEKKITTRGPHLYLISLGLSSLGHLYNVTQLHTISTLWLLFTHTGSNSESITALSTFWNIFPEKHCLQLYWALSYTRTDVASIQFHCY